MCRLALHVLIISMIVLSANVGARQFERQYSAPFIIAGTGNRECPAQSVRDEQRASILQQVTNQLRDLTNATSGQNQTGNQRTYIASYYGTSGNLYGSTINIPPPEPS